MTDKDNLETQEYVEKLEEMFATDGWKKMKSDLEDTVRQLSDTISRGMESDQYHYNVGRISSYRAVIALPDVIETVRKQLEEEKTSLDELP